MPTDALCDLHVHTKYSCDSEAALEDYCIRAIEKNVRRICFTEHVDFDVHDSGYGYYDAAAFFDEFSKVKEKFSSKVELLSGLEFSEIHLYQEAYHRLLRYPYDFIIGSLHYWYQDMFPGEMVKEGIPLTVCYESYWDEILRMVSCGGFDCLGHIDFPKRYYGASLIDRERLFEICRALVRNNICLEINTSSLRKGLSETMPDKEILSVYRSCGGEYITLGSDAHHADDLAAGHEYARGLIAEFGLREVFFRSRQLYFVSGE
jgi:histidinol-phosphatase (PHP family)